MIYIPMIFAALWAMFIIFYYGREAKPQPIALDPMTLSDERYLVFSEADVLVFRTNDHAEAVKAARWFKGTILESNYHA